MRSLFSIASVLFLSACMHLGGPPEMWTNAKSAQELQVTARRDGAKSAAESLQGVLAEVPAKPKSDARLKMILSKSQVAQKRLAGSEDKYKAYQAWIKETEQQVPFPSDAINNLAVKASALSIEYTTVDGDLRSLAQEVNSYMMTAH